MTKRAVRREPSNADYDALFELTGTPTLELDGAGLVVRLNPAAARALGVDPRTAAGQTLDDLLQTDATAVLASVGPTDVDATTSTGTVRFTARSRRRTLAGTESDRFTVQLQRAASMGDPQPERRGDVANWSVMDDVSHNLGTPLSIIAGYAETLAARLDDMSPEHVTTAAAAIHRHAVRAVDELHALQARVRVTSGGAGTVPTSVLIAWLRRMLQANLITNGTVLVGRSSEEIVTVDVGVARQVLLNICSVALQSRPAPTLIELLITPDAEGTSFEVRAEPEGLAELSDSSFTVSATRRLVATGGGTYSPPTPESPSHDVWLPSTSRTVSEEASATIPVAVIEDDPDAAALIRASLQNSAAVFDLVADERTFDSGLAAIAETQPRIVLLDQGLPDRNGTDGIAELQALVPAATIIVLSMRGPLPEDALPEGIVWLEKGHVLADLGSQLITILAGRE